MERELGTVRRSALQSVFSPRVETSPTAAAEWPRRAPSPRGASGGSETCAEEAWRAQPGSTRG